MQAQFWLDKWARQEIGFHQADYNEHLVRFWSELNLKAGDRVFVPLCGKSKDLVWLHQKGFEVVGIELCETAVSSFFDALACSPTVTKMGALTSYRTEGIEILLGDFFDLTPAHLGDIQGVYDRAALVALPHQMRVLYTQHLSQVTAAAPQLLVCLKYDQNEMDGPPFSITEASLREYYYETFRLRCLETARIPEGFKSVSVVDEHIWLLMSRG